MALRNSFFKALLIALLILFAIQGSYLYIGDSFHFPLLRTSSTVDSSTLVSCAGYPENHDCYPSIISSLPSDKRAAELCPGATPSDSNRTVSAPRRIALVTAQFGEPKPHYERALGTQMMLSKIHHLPLFILRGEITDSLWNKPAYILSILLAEMAKPEDQRLEWLLWLDRDVIILDKCRAPATFLPSSVSSGEKDAEAERNVQMLVTKDWNGLNNGIFLVRVGKWSLDLFSDIMAFRHYKPDVELRFTEQSAMEILLEEERHRKALSWVPQWWFNAYPGPRWPFGTGDQAELKSYHARPGDFLVHFAGAPHRGEAMKPWLQLAEDGYPENVSGLHGRDIDYEIGRFWSRWNETLHESEPV